MMGGKGFQEVGKITREHRAYKFELGEESGGSGPHRGEYDQFRRENGWLP